MAFGFNPWLLTAIVIWTFIWKGKALWRAAQLRQKGWYIALLIVNTLGILEIIYLYWISRKYDVVVEVIEEKE